MRAFIRRGSPAIESRSAQKEREYLRNRHRGSNAPRSQASLASNVNAFSHFAEASSRRGRRRWKEQREERAIKSAIAHAADLCPLPDRDAIKSDISGGAIYRDSAKSATGRSVVPIKTGPLSLATRWWVYQDRRPTRIPFPRCLPLCLGLDHRREKMSRAKFFLKLIYFYKKYETGITYWI